MLRAARSVFLELDAKLTLIKWATEGEVWRGHIFGKSHLPQSSTLSERSEYNQGTTPVGIILKPKSSFTLARTYKKQRPPVIEINSVLSTTFLLLQYRSQIKKNTDFDTKRLLRDAYLEKVL